MVLPSGAASRLAAAGPAPAQVAVAKVPLKVGPPAKASAQDGPSVVGQATVSPPPSGGEAAQPTVGGQAGRPPPRAGHRRW
eukprot:13752618-Alexandrium_andersonii.AAC.1